MCPQIWWRLLRGMFNIYIEKNKTHYLLICRNSLAQIKHFMYFFLTWKQIKTGGVSLISFSLLKQTIAPGG